MALRRLRAENDTRRMDFVGANGMHIMCSYVDPGKSRSPKMIMEFIFNVDGGRCPERLKELVGLGGMPGTFRRLVDKAMKFQTG